LARIFKADAALQDRIFSGKRILIKKGADTRQALLYKKNFEKCGLKCIFREISDMPESPETPRDKKATEPIVCPKCGYSQPKSAECIKCGVVIKKAEKALSLKSREKDEADTMTKILTGYQSVLSHKRLFRK
jgi:hypothetical protein